MRTRLLRWLGYKLYWWSRWCWDRAGGEDAYIDYDRRRATDNEGKDA